MNEKSTIAKFYDVLELYHLTLEYVGYDTLPFLPGWSHYEALRHNPVLFQHHEEKYAEHRVMRDEQRRAIEHVGCITNEDCLYSKSICHQTCYDQRGLAHAHK